VLAALGSSTHGLSHAEARERLQRHGRNALPRPEPPSLLRVLLTQFASPLIYILAAAAVVSLAVQEYTDAGFIAAVLLINAIIGAAQEYSAQRSALALQRMVVTNARVQRSGDAYEIDATELVPGDIVLLESGAKVPADLRLLHEFDLTIDESLLTGESLPVAKDATAVLAPDSGLGDRVNMAFAGTMVSRGRRARDARVGEQRFLAGCRSARRCARSRRAGAAAASLCPALHVRL
jgi:magnesium-transporting ATPase (P-type)